MQVTRRRGLPAAALAGLLLVTACSGTTTEIGGSPSAPRLEALATGPDGLIPEAERQALPSLVGTTLDGKPLDVATYRGKVVVLNFWASWCPPCRDEAPSLVEVATQTRPLGVEFVGVNIKDEQTSAAAFERKAAVPYPSLHDQPGELLLRFRGIVPQTPPTTLIIDREGRIAGFFAGKVRISELLTPVETVAAEA